MKPRILTISLLLLFFLLGCSKEDVLEPVTSDQATAVYHKLEQKEGTFEWSTIRGKASGQQQLVPKPANEHLFTRGAYLPEGRPMIKLTWVGQCDDAGVYGNAEVEVVAADFSFHFIMTAEAIMGEDNNAIFEGTIVDIKSKTGNTPEFDLYWRYCFNVTDVKSFEGNVYDQICKAMIFGSPRSPLICSMYPPGHYMWRRAGSNDVKPPGFVEVDNCPEKVD